MSGKINGNAPGKNRAISTTYVPKERAGEFGWLWVPEEMSGQPAEWTLVHTLNYNGVPVVRAAEDTTSRAFDAKLFDGLPYLPIRRPECSKTAGFMAHVFLPNGQMTAIAINDPGPMADMLRTNFLHIMHAAGGPVAGAPV